MPDSQLTLKQGKFYHIYNRGINSCNLFCESDNYAYFLRLYDKHISPVADTYAWVLMPNHFHFLIRLKDNAEVSDNLNLTGFENLSGLNKPPHQYFSNLFNAYTKAFNKRFSRHGSLFERPFKRKPVDEEEYFKQLILYIHNNPVHLGFSIHPVEYPWSSYLTCISSKDSKLKRDKVIGWFENKDNFVAQHRQPFNIRQLERWLGSDKYSSFENDSFGIV